MEKYMLSEAWKIAKVGDRIVLMKKVSGEEIEDYYIEISRLNESGVPCTFNSPFEPPSIRQSTSDQWQIIPAKKEMVSFDDWSEKEGYSVPYVNGMHISWKASAKNRDILYADLMEAIKRGVDAEESEEFEKYEQIIDDLRSAYNNVNAVLHPATSSTDSET